MPPPEGGADSDPGADESDGCESYRGAMSGIATALTRWFDAPVQVRDAVLASALTVFAQLEVMFVDVAGSLIQQRVSFAMITAAIAWRRTVPLLAAGVVSVGIVLQTLAGPAPVAGPFVAMLIVTYSLGAHLTRWRSAVGLFVVLAGVHSYPLVQPEQANLADELGNLAIFVGLWLLGRTVRLREHRADTERRRAVAAETDREAYLQQALDDERERIAGELHDLVAHGVSVMVLQAGAGRQALDRDPVRTREALLAVESTGRQALDEMHRLLGLLRRNGDSSAPLEPPATLADLGSLIARIRAAGLTADAHIEGDARPLGPGVELNAYRIIQEALTNTLKHAQASQVCVRLNYRPDCLLIDIVDDGRSTAGSSRTLGGAGHGTISMRERVAMFDGDVVMGPAPDGGWRVSARLSTRAAS